MNVPTITKPAQAYGRNPLAIRHRLLAYGPIAGRAWASQIKRRPGDADILAAFTVEATEQEVDDVVNVIIDVHLADPDVVGALPNSSWYDVLEVPVEGEPFALFRRELVHTKGITTV